MNPNKRTLVLGVGSFFASALVHSLLPPGDIWVRAALTGGAAVVIFGVLSWLLPRSSEK